MEHKRTNREKKLSAKKEKFWCRCDMAHVGQFGRCPVCKRQNGKRKLKGY